MGVSGGDRINDGKDQRRRRRGVRWCGKFKLDLGGTSPPRTVINGQPHPAMAAEGGRDDRTTLGQYPGFDLSISELCHALKTKLAQAWDSRYAYITAARHLLSDN